MGTRTGEVMEVRYLIYNENEGEVQGRLEPTEGDARIQAAELAGEHPGMEFSVFKLVDTCKSKGVAWKSELERPDKSATPTTVAGKCLYCGAGDNSYHSSSCPTGLHPHPDRQENSLNEPHGWERVK